MRRSVSISRFFERLGASVAGLHDIGHFMTRPSRCSGWAGALVAALLLLPACSKSDRKGPDLPPEGVGSATSQSSSKNGNSDAIVIFTAGSARDGRRLYASNCEDCHNKIEKSDKKGSSPELILKAIGRISEMRHLDDLSVSDISSLAEALK